MRAVLLVVAVLVIPTNAYLPSWKTGKYKVIQGQLPTIHHLSSIANSETTCHVVGPCYNATIDLCTGRVLTRHPLPPSNLVRPIYGPRSAWGYNAEGRGVVVTPRRTFDLPDSCHLASFSCERYHISIMASNVMVVVDMDANESITVELPTTCLCVTVRRDTAYLGSIDGDVYVYRMLTSEFLAVRLPYNPSPIRCIKVSSDGNSVFEQMVLGCQDGHVRVARWYYPTPVGSVDEHTVTYTRKPHDSPVLAMAIDEHRCVSYSDGQRPGVGVLSFGSATENWTRMMVHEKIDHMALNDRFLVLSSAISPQSHRFTILDFHVPGGAWSIMDGIGNRKKNAGGDDDDDSDDEGDNNNGGGGMIVLR